MIRIENLIKIVVRLGEKNCRAARETTIHKPITEYRRKKTNEYEMNLQRLGLALNQQVESMWKPDHDQRSSAVPCRLRPRLALPPSPTWC